jgi:hypothetical protein
VPTPTKEQVIAAVEPEIDWPTRGTKRIKPVALVALRRLTRKRRVSQDQERLFWLVESVWQAIKRGDAAIAAAPPDRQTRPRRRRYRPQAAKAASALPRSSFIR